MTPSELRKAEARYRRVFRRLEEVQRTRDATIRAAHSEGMTTRAIAEHIGISHQRVAQLVKPKS